MVYASDKQKQKKKREWKRETEREIIKPSRLQHHLPFSLAKIVLILVADSQLYFTKVHNHITTVSCFELLYTNLKKKTYTFQKMWAMSGDVNFTTSRITWEMGLLHLSGIIQGKLTDTGRAIFFTDMTTP